ncbi:MAG: transcriptional regulator [Burkholderiales bacterium]|nr:MAG: transcriptional regulator [Burkholderiales bacterium]
MSVRPHGSAPMSALMHLLESRYAMRVLWALSDGHPQTFRLLQDSVGGATPNTLNTRLKELRAARLVEHGGDGYRLTHLGHEVARRLHDWQATATRWHQQVQRVGPARPDTGEGLSAQTMGAGTTR